MNSKKAFLAAAAAAAAIPLLLCAPGYVTKEQREQMTGRNYAHRGLHSEDKSVPENSMRAFDLAVSQGYGVELDVRLTKDGEVVVFHDDTLERVCGDPRRVDELTYQELLEMRLCGTDQQIPRFRDVLELVNGRGPLIVEIKPGKNRSELCRKTRDLLDGYGGEYCVESFDPFAITWFRLHAPKVMRGQLSMPKEMYKDMNPVMKYVLSHCLVNVAARPQFIAYKVGKQPVSVRICEKLGALNAGWVSREQANEKHYDSMIFEFYHPDVRYK